MHFVVCKAENFKILLAPSPKYTGLRDEAPRFMGEGLFLLTLFCDNLICKLGAIQCLCGQEEVLVDGPKSGHFCLRLG